MIFSFAADTICRGFQYKKEVNVEKYQRNRQAAWDKRHLKTISTKMTKGEYERFLDKCYLARIKPYTLVKQLVRDWMEGKRQPELPKVTIFWDL